MEELISVIIPFYNAEEYIEKCIRSVRKQTYKNWELILVNDGSTDNSSNIIKHIIDDSHKKNEKIHLYEKVNEGVSVARNFGIEKSKGEWITFLDADDIFKNTFFEEAIRNSEKDCDIILGGIDTNNGEKYLIQQKKTYKGVEKEEIIKRLLNVSKNKSMDYNSRLLGYSVARLYKKEIVKKVKFPPGIKFKEDMIFNLQAFNLANKIILIPSIWYEYYKNTNSACYTYFPNYTEEVKEYYKICKEIIKNIKFNLENDFYICMLNMYINWLKIYVINKENKLSKKEKIEKIEKSFYDKFWRNIFEKVDYKKLTKVYKVVYILYIKKYKKTIFQIIKINNIKNEKTYRRK